MTAYILQRLIQSVLVLLAVSVVVFLAFYGIGDPIELLVPPQVSAAERTAIATLDDGKRSEILQQAGTKVLEGGAFIPLHFESTVWAYKANLKYVGRADQFTMAMQVKPAK